MSEFQPMFLFGSGISPAPGVAPLTEKILTADLYREGDDTWLPAGRGNKALVQNPYDDSQAVRRLLQSISATIFEHRKSAKIPESVVTYEDVANICTQLEYHADTGRNAAIQDYYDRLQINSGLNRADFGKLCWVARQWVEWSCHEFLKPPPEREITAEFALKRSALGRFVQDVVHASPQSTIVTLNHDVYLDEALGDEAVFGFGGSGRKIFHPDTRRNAPHRLIKLHGSVDWYLAGAHNVAVRSNTPFFFDRKSPPLILSGTISKLEDYNYSVFPWLWAEFQNSLRDTRRLVVSGYGFKDLGVNSRLTDWLNHYPDARMLVLHGHPEKLLDDVSKSSLGGVSGFFRNRKFVIKDAASDEVNAQIVIAPAWFQEAVAAPWPNYINAFLES